MDLKPRWLLARGGESVYGPICRRFNRMGPALWQEPPVLLPSIWGQGPDFKLFPVVPLFVPGLGQERRDPGGISDILSDQQYPQCSVTSQRKQPHLAAKAAPGAAGAGDPKSGWASTNLLLLSLITGEKLQSFPR